MARWLKTNDMRALACAEHRVDFRFDHQETVWFIEQICILHLSMQITLSMYRYYAKLLLFDWILWKNRTKTTAKWNTHNLKFSCREMNKRGLTRRMNRMTNNFANLCVCAWESTTICLATSIDSEQKKTRSRFIYFGDILKRQMQLIRFFGAHSHETKGKEWKEKWCSDNSGISLLSINYIIATKVSIQIWLDHRESERERKKERSTLSASKKVRFTSIPCDTIDFNEY